MDLLSIHAYTDDRTLPERRESRVAGEPYDVETEGEAGPSSYVSLRMLDPSRPERVTSTVNPDRVSADKTVA
jgi:hypothetical protein